MHFDTDSRFIIFGKNAPGCVLLSLPVQESIYSATVAVLNVTSVSVKKLCPTQLPINNSYYSSYNACVYRNTRAAICTMRRNKTFKG